LPLFQKSLVVFIQFEGDRILDRRVLTIIEEEVVAFVLLIDSFAEHLVDFLQVGEGVHIGDLVLLGVIVNLIVIELVVISDGIFDDSLTLDQ
jgi:hypothetical protein